MWRLQGAIRVQQGRHGSDICIHEVRGVCGVNRVPDECSEAVADLISACMEADPASRPSAREIVDMLAATGNETALQSAAERRKQKHTQVESKFLKHSFSSKQSR